MIHEFLGLKVFEDLASSASWKPPALLLSLKQFMSFTCDKDFVKDNTYSTFPKRWPGCCSKESLQCRLGRPRLSEVEEFGACSEGRYRRLNIKRV